MREHRLAAHALLSADSVSATVTTGSTSSVIALASGAASFAAHDVVNLTGTGATAANNLRVVQVTEVDTAAQTLTVTPAVPVAPASGDVVSVGWRQWVRAPGDAGDDWLHSGDLYGEHPSLAVLREAPSTPYVVGVLVEVQPMTRTVASLETADFRLRIVGLDAEWVEGAARRAVTVLDRRHADYVGVAPVGYVWRSTVGVLERPEPRDSMREVWVPLQLSMSEAA